VNQLISQFGERDAALLWTSAVDGVALIAATAREHEFACDLAPMDSLFVATGSKGVEEVAAEGEARTALGYESQQYGTDALARIHPGGYLAGIRYGRTWSLDPFSYCQALRRLLIARGVRIYEDTALQAIAGRTATTTHGAVSASRIVVCANQLPRRLNHRAYREYYLANTVLAITAPLGAREVAALFPEDRFQCWDDRWIYNYYRLTPDNRLLLGGGSVFTTLTPWVERGSKVVDATIDRFRRRFPALAGVRFECYWSGAIDISRDLLPIVAADPDAPHLHFVIGSASLPWAAWGGDELGRQVNGGVQSGTVRLLGWERKTLVPSHLRSALGKPLSFAIELTARRMMDGRID
jgi:gamma-glutamylputrescine oxidase